MIMNHLFTLFTSGHGSLHARLSIVVFDAGLWHHGASFTCPMTILPNTGSLQIGRYEEAFSGGRLGLGEKLHGLSSKPSESVLPAKEC